MMNRFFLWTICLSAMNPVSATENYFQQYVTYTMAISLDIEEHTIEGNSVVNYTNNSPDVLTNIYLHLLPNAFQKGSVKYREYKQKFGRQSRAAKFIKGMDAYFSRIEVSQLQIFKDGTILADTFKVDDTILSAALADPLQPGETLTMELNWVHHIGEQVERAGRVDEQYNMAQWYPKVVVYDEQGWHDNPFHAEGEFYGEFGTYDVTLDVPGWYIVGATGTVTAGDPGWSEVTVDTTIHFDKWLENYLDYKPEIDSTSRRIVTFHAQQVHDFAWITSPNFLYEHGSWNDIDVHVLYNADNGQKWTKEVVKRSERALAWLSKRFGKYPYPQVTTADRIKSGGMEYPMLVMNGSERESLILHEIGHIWFYGIIGNDEVAEAWLDEGFTTFQTGQYMMDRYGAQGFDLNNRDIVEPLLKEYGKFTSLLANVQWSAIRYQTSGKDEPISRKSYLYNSSSSYYYNAYIKPALMLTELKYVLGDSLFYMAMQEYYRRWNLKHTNAARFISAMEDVSGTQLDWFFDPWLHQTQILDYDLKRMKSKQLEDGTWAVSLWINKLGQREMPQLVEVELTNGQRVRKWWTNHQSRKKDVFTFNVNSQPRAAALDPDAQTMDLDRRNNHSRFMPVDWQFGLLNTNYNPRDRYAIHWLPLLYYHEFDGHTPGLGLKLTYGPWRTLTTEINYAMESSTLYWGFSNRGRSVHRFPNNEYYFYAYNQGSVSGYGLDVAFDMGGSWFDFVADKIHLGFYSIETLDTNRTDLYDPGSVFMVYSKYGFSFPRGSLDLDLFSAPAGFTDWSFSRLSTSLKLDIPFFKIDIRDRVFVGFMWSDESGIPLQERYSVAGAGSRATFAYHYLRDESSFYGNRNLRQNYHLAGDANLRGYVGANFGGADKVLANTFEAFYKTKFNLEFAFFLDHGSIWTPRDCNCDLVYKGEVFFDAGFGLRYSQKFLGKNYYLRVDFPLWVRDMTPGFETIQYQDDTWIFSFSPSI